MFVVTGQNVVITTDRVATALTSIAKMSNYYKTGYDFTGISRLIVAT